MSDETIKCPKCGLENSRKDNFCQSCGAKLKEIVNDNIKTKALQQIQTKKNLMFSFVTEIIAFFTIVFFTSVAPVFHVVDVLQTRISNTDNVFEQLYASITFVEQSIVIVIGLLFVFALWSVFKFNRIEQRIVEMQNLAEPEPSQRLLTWFGFAVGIIIFVILSFLGVTVFVR